MTDPARPLNLILCWHMHQPDYRSQASGEFVLPWTYLHAAKDYTDMAWHLEQNPGMRVVVNFVPVLLDQLEDYANQFKTGQIRDPLLRLLAREDLRDVTAAERRMVLERCFCANHASMIEPYPAYRHLLQLFREVDAHEGKHYEYLSSAYLGDLLTWYHLIWTGESVRRSCELVARLMAQGHGFSYTDRRLLFELYGDLIGMLIPRYRALVASGQIEVSATPHHHPIAPLLIDLKSAREAQPDAVLPEAERYPGGLERLAMHVDSALESHAVRFGRRPAGMWPAEGAISEATLALLARHGVRWAASGQGVLANSLRRAGPLPAPAQYLYRPYFFGSGDDRIACFFRDDRLADLIGFEYSKWFARDAVAHFIGELERIYAATPAEESPVVSVILDGENAWEYYPYNGYYFLMELYEALVSHPFIRPTTFDAYLSRCEGPRPPAGCATAGRLDGVVAGSWVYGNLATWIGSADKNHAWDLLCAAKQSYDLVMGSGRLSEAERAAAARQLAVCESSDWFWWFGDYHSPLSVSTFDKLFRENLSNLYRLLQLPVPEVLAQPISQGGSGTPAAGGTMIRVA